MSKLYRVHYLKQNAKDVCIEYLPEYVQKEKIKSILQWCCGKKIKIISIELVENKNY